MVDYTYNREIVGGIYNISVGSVDGKIEASGLPSRKVRCDFDVCTISFEQDLTVEQKNILDAVIVEEKSDITVLKNIKISAVRDKTIEEEAEGVPYNGHRFSVTPSAKSNWLAIVVASASLTYPFSAPTGFEDIYEFQNVGDVQAFFSASMTFLKYWEESNEQLIILIDVCTTKEQLDAIVDDRAYPPS